MNRAWIIFCLLVGLSKMGVFAQCPPYSLGADTVIDCGSSVTLQAPAGWGNYLWSNGAHTSSITVSTVGNYWCRSIDTLSNVVVNSDFSAGATGFSSDYVPGTGGTWGILSNPGTYAVTTNSHLVHSNFPTCYDHTTNNGTNPMLVVNGASIAGQRVWYQTITVQPNTNYIFSVWFSSVDPASPAILQFSVNATNLGSPFTLSPSTCFWQNFSSTWNSGASTSAVISIRNQNTAGGGNDFAIDDITFAPICDKRDTINVSLPPTPVVNVTGGDTICSGDSVQLTVTSNVPGSNFQWTSGQTDSVITVNPSADTWYTAWATYRNCVSSPDSVQVVLAPSFTASVTGPSSICLGETAQISATVSGGSGPVNTLWMPVNTSDTLINVSPANTTTYTFTVSDNCMADTLTHLLVVNPLPAPVITVEDNHQCMPMCTSFDLTTATSAQNITWNFGDNNNGLGPDPSHCYQQAGLYDISVVVEDVNGCIDSTTMPGLVEVFPLPIAGFFADPGYITSLDPSLQFTNTSSGSSTYQWSFGDGDNSTEENPDHTYIPYQILDEEITAQLIVTSIHGCSDTAYQVLSVQNLSTFYVPNAFTPNGDELNELFLPKGTGINRIKTCIFDRWGEMIFSSEDINPSWNGTHQSSGDPCPTGVYVYDINYFDSAGKEYHLTGHISLLR